MTYIDIVAWQLLWSFEPGRVRPGDGASFYFEAICFSRSILCKWRSMLWFSFESNIPHTSEFHVWGRRARLFRVSNASLKTPRPSWASRTRTYRSHRSLGPRGWTWEAIGEPISTPSCGRHFQGHKVALPWKKKQWKQMLILKRGMQHVNSRSDHIWSIIQM